MFGDVPFMNGGSDNSMFLTTRFELYLIHVEHLLCTLSWVSYEAGIPPPLKLSMALLQVLNNNLVPDSVRSYLRGSGGGIPQTPLVGMRERATILFPPPPQLKIC